MPNWLKRAEFWQAKSGRVGVFVASRRTCTTIRWATVARSKGDVPVTARHSSQKLVPKLRGRNGKRRLGPPRRWTSRNHNRLGWKAGCKI